MKPFVETEKNEGLLRHLTHLVIYTKSGKLVKFKGGTRMNSQTNLQQKNEKNCHSNVKIIYKCTTK